MQRCVDTLLVAGGDAEIIIVDDGSTDRTAEIADGYAERFPDIVSVIHKQNGGHGSCVNLGVHSAKGLYFKVVDSDDWLDKEALEKLISTIRTHVNGSNLPDIYICNFIYFHAADKTNHVSRYGKKMPQGFVDWNKVKKFRFAHVILMHALVYNTRKLRENYTDLPENTFYVDNILAYAPLAHMLRAYYLDVDLYNYYIGREGQSVNISTAMSRYRQQITVMEIMAAAHSYDDIKKLPKGLKNYMFHYLLAVMMNTLMFALGKVSKERKSDVRAMWKRIKASDKKMYRKLKYRGYPLSVIFLPARLRSKLMMFGYRVLCKKIKLG